MLSWLHPCLSVDPAARPTAKQLLQHPFFVRIAQSVDARTLAAAAAQESGDAEAAAEARAPWLVFEHSAAMGYGPSGFTPLLRGSDDGSGSSDGWGGLQLLGTTDAGGLRPRRVVVLGGGVHMPGLISAWHRPCGPLSARALDQCLIAAWPSLPLRMCQGMAVHPQRLPKTFRLPFPALAKRRSRGRSGTHVGRRWRRSLGARVCRG